MTNDIPDSYDPEWVVEMLRMLDDFISSGNLSKASEIVHKLRCYHGF